LHDNQPFDKVFPIEFAKDCLKEMADSLAEAGSNTSTVALRVVGGDEKGSLESETVK
jgi:hypothetical protein